MAGAPVGSVVSIYIDAAQVLDEGDFVTTRTGRAYRVLANRIQERGKHIGRQHLRVMVVDLDEVERGLAEDPQRVSLPIFWYSRG